MLDPMENPQFANLDALLGHGDFVRGLAKSLLFDEHTVDDVVQETWLASLKGSPKAKNEQRNWLAVVTRHFAFQAKRKEQRVQRKEQAGARSEHVPSTSEIVERESSRREVVEAVLALDEIYRGAILLRFYEDLPPREIASRLELPVETVRTRLKRGLEQLRERLDRNHGGDRRSWCLGLIPLALPTKTAAAAATFGGLAALIQGILAMNIKIKLGLLVVALIGFGAGVLPLVDRNADPVTETPRFVSKISDSPPSSEQTKTIEVTPRAQIENEISPKPPGWKVYGKVTGTNGAVLAGANIRLRLTQGKDILESALAKSDEAGNYSAFLPTVESHYSFTPFSIEVHLTADRHEQLNVSQTLPHERPTQYREIQMDLRTELGSFARGRVVNESGEPVSEAEILISWERSEEESQKTLDGALRPSRGTYSLRCDAEGYYEAYINYKGFHVFRAHDAKWGSSSSGPIWLSKSSDQEIPDLVLRPLGTLEGIAVHFDGRAISNLELEAVVEEWRSEEQPQFKKDESFLQNLGVSYEKTKTNSQGRFRFCSLRPGNYVIRNPKDRTAAESIYATDQFGIELVLPIYQLRLSAMDESGKIIPGAKLRAHIYRENNLESKDDLKKSLKSGTLPKGWINEISHLGDSKSIAVEPGDLVFCEANATDAQPTNEIVEIDEGDYQKDVFLVLKPLKLATGKIHLTITDSNWRPLKGFRAKLTWPSGDTLKDCENRRVEESGAFFLAPPGKYELQAQPDAFDCLYFTVQESVEVLAGQEIRKVIPVTKLGGRLRMTLHLEGQREKPQIVSASYALLSKLDETHSVWIDSDFYEMSGFISEHDMYSPVLEPGLYRLSIQASGFQNVEQNFEIIAGEITELKLSMFPK